MEKVHLDLPKDPLQEKKFLSNYNRKKQSLISNYTGAQGDKLNLQLFTPRQIQDPSLQHNYNSERDVTGMPYRSPRNFLGMQNNFYNTTPGKKGECVTLSLSEVNNADVRNFLRYDSPDLRSPRAGVMQGSHGNY
jgi:hypothetical protein